MNRKLILISGLILVATLLMECEDDDESYAMDKILKLELLDTVSMKADGKRQFTVKAKLPSNASDKYKTVTFATGSGKFETSDKETVEKQIDSEGIAEVTLIVGTDPGIHFVTASIGSEDPKFSVSEKFTLTPLATSEIITVTIFDTLNIRADGNAVIRVDADIDNTSLEVVTVSSNEGAFLGSDKDTDNSKVDQDGVASFRLQVGTNPTKYYIVTSVSEGIRMISEVNVRRAHGESMLIEAGSLKVDDESPVSISVFLTRAKGKVSSNTPILFEATQLDNSNNVVSVGRFTGISKGTDDEGKVTVNFYADSGNIMTDRVITILIKSPKDSGPPLDGKVVLKFTP